MLHANVKIQIMEEVNADGISTKARKGFSKNSNFIIFQVQVFESNQRSHAQNAIRRLCNHAMETSFNLLNGIQARDTLTRLLT